MLRKKTISFVVLVTLILNTLGVGTSYGIVAPTGSVALSLDKSNPNVGEVITATLSVKDIPNFAGYQVNIKYDPSVLAPVYSDGSDYDSTATPDDGTLLCRRYSPAQMGTNDLINGSLCFGKTYMGLTSYRASGKPETTGSVAVVYFKVLKKATTRILMVNTANIAKGIDGTILFDWYGEQSMGYNVYQANEINSLPAKGYLDNPLNNQVISTNSVSVYGWFLDPYGVSKIEVLVDGNVIGNGVYGDPRSDVAKVYPDYNNLNSGYHYYLNTSSLSAGIHTIQVRETGNTGIVSYTNTKKFTVRKAIGFIDSPSKTASALSGTYNVVGWFGDTTGVAKVSILVDGVKVGDAVYGLSRSDVPKVYPYFNSTTGYSFKLNTLSLSNGTHAISVVETGTYGDQTIISPRTITVLN